MGSWNWVGDTGMKTSVVHTIENYVGDTYPIPLFKPLNDGTEKAPRTPPATATAAITITTLSSS